MLKSREGERVPDVTFRTREGAAWKDVTTKDVFAGKKVVPFALPGAFTPTCSSSHVPRYNELASVLEKSGWQYDEIPATPRRLRRRKRQRQHAPDIHQ
ncbi:MAG TPA: redoxin family protein [Polyangiaceae bacterium]